MPLLLDDMKLVLRLTTSAMDDEVQMLVDAALAELARVGVRAEYLDQDEPSPLAKQAVALYCKAHFGYDNDESDRFSQSFTRVEIDLLNSTANIAASRLSLGDAVVSDVPDQPYTGNTVRPVPTVTYDGAELVNGADFTLSYLNNTEVGTATVLVKGTGGYCGTVARDFKVVGE